MRWQEEFVETFYEVVKQENIIFSRFNKNEDEWIPRSVVDLTERQWQYLLFKGLMTNNYFDRWVIQLEQAYSDRKHAEMRIRRADFMLSKIKYGKSDYNSTICIEMKNGLNKKVKDDYKRLQKYSNFRGLLIYKFKRRPIKLETKINESPEFKKLMNKLKIIAPGDMKVNVVNKGGNYERYHFEAVLLSW